MDGGDGGKTIKRTLVDTIKRWKVRRALKMLKRHRITIRKAADVAGISYTEMLDKISESGIDIGYSLSDLEKDIK